MIHENCSGSNATAAAWTRWPDGRGLTDGILDNDQGWFWRLRPRSSSVHEPRGHNEWKRPTARCLEFDTGAESNSRFRYNLDQQRDVFAGSDFRFAGEAEVGGHGVGPGGQTDEKAESANEWPVGTGGATSI